MRPKVVMVSGTHAKLADQLRFREIDVLVSQLAITSSDLKNLEKVEVPVNLVSSLNKKIRTSKNSSSISKSLGEIAGGNIVRWAIPSASFKLRSEINEFFEVNDLKGQIVFESDVIESITRSAVDGVGISLLPLIYVPNELKNKKLFSFGPKKGFWKHRIWISCHQGSESDPLVKSLSNSFKKICEPLISK